MGERMSLQLAASHVQSSYHTLRRLTQKGLITAYKNKKGHVQVDLAEVLAHFANSKGAKQVTANSKLTNQDDPLFAMQVARYEDAKAHIKELQTQLQESQSEKRELHQQVRELQGEILKLVAEIRALLKDDKQGWQLPFRWKRT